MKTLSVALTAAIAQISAAQFVFPKPEYNAHDPGVYTEDPFIIEYRHKFFSVFHGDFATFQKARKEIDAMLEKNPRDARALVWKGNGQTIQATILNIQGKKEEAKALAATSRTTLDQAVALRPNDPNIYMMRVATLYIQGQYFPEEWVPRSAWTELRNDCRRFLNFFGPAKIPKLSIHVRGEALGEMGIAEEHLGNVNAARKDFERLIQVDAGTDYEVRARKELAKLDAKKSS